MINGARKTLRSAKLSSSLRCLCTNQCPVLDSIFVCSILLYHEACLVLLRRKGPTRCLGLSNPGPTTLVRMGLDRMRGIQSNSTNAPLKSYIWVVDIILLLLLICGNILLLRIYCMFMLHICCTWLVAINPSNIRCRLGNRK